MGGLVNWHQHSCYSFFDGASLPSDIARRCRELGMTHCMLTDHGNVAGHLDMYRACQKEGLTPVLGTELYVKDDRYDNGRPKGWHMVLFALNDVGLRNVWAISSASYYATSDAHRTPNATWDMMEGHGDGVVCTSACLAGVLSEAALRDDVEMADYWVGRCSSTFQEFCIELHVNSMPEQRKANMWLLRYARERGIRVVYAVDSHYVMPEDAEFQDVWLGCATKSYYDQEHFRMGHEYHIHDEREIRSALAYLGEDAVEECFANVERYMSMVEPIGLDETHKVPRFDVPDGFADSKGYLLALLAKGMVERVCHGRARLEDGEVVVEDAGDASGVAERMEELRDKELPIIFDNGLEDYFLMVADYCQYAREHMLVGPGRGSAAGSLACYLLGITTVDPTGRGLIFERFLNQGRLGTYIVETQESGVVELGERAVVSVVGKGEAPASSLSVGDVIEHRVCWDGSIDLSVMGEVSSIRFRGGELPDIDVDFQDSGKALVHRHLIDTYGADKVTAVGTITFFGMKLAIKEMCRYYRVPIQESNRLTSIVEQAEELAGKGGDWRQGLSLMDGGEKALVGDVESRFPDLFRYAERMVGLCRQPGKHAAGYVMSPVPLADRLPVRKACHAGDEPDEIISQFDKYQVEALGFVKADILGLRNLTTLRMAADMVAERTGEAIDYYSLIDDPDDLSVWSQFDDGRTLGLFQMEGRGITDVARNLRPRSVSDVSAIIALYRPGVIGAGMLDEYVARARGEKPVEYVTSMLEGILDQTYGVIVYQEQAMAIFSRLGGFTDAEADQIRGAIGHKKLDKIQAAKPKFVAGCAKNGISEECALEIFKQIEASGNYSFNKCLTGDVMLHRASTSNRDVEFPTADITVEGLYRRFNSKSAVGAKYRDKNRGVWVIARDADGRARKARVNDVVCNGEREVFEIALSDGKKVKATANHRFMRPDGSYAMVSELAIGDSLVTCDFNYEIGSGVSYSFTGKEQNPKGKSYGHRKGFPSGALNPGYIDGQFSAWKQERDEMVGKPCERCGALHERMELHHKNGNRDDNSKENLEWLCVSCHKKAHYDMGRVRRGQKGYPTSCAEILSITPCGVEMTYDVEMDSSEHNFFANGVCSHNSHSYAYATITFWTAWMKAHHSVEFYAASMSTVGPDKAPLYMQEARRRGISIVPPTVRSPAEGYVVLSDDSIAFGLVNVKGCGTRAIENIVTGAPYSGFEDFVDRSGCNSAVIKTLIDGGFFRELYPNARDLKMRYEANDFRANLFNEGVGDGEEGNGFTCAHRPYTDEEVEENELAIYGMVLSIDRFDRYRRVLGERVSSTLADVSRLESMSDGQAGNVLCVITDIRKVRTKKGDLMAFLTLQLDTEEVVEATMFPKLLEAAGQWVRKGAHFVMELIRDSYKGRATWHVGRIKHLDD